MEIIGKIIGYLIVGGIFLLFLGAFAVLFKINKVMDDVRKEEKKGNFYLHDGWKDGTWYGGGSDGGD